jgi:hypothetical protein
VFWGSFVGRTTLMHPFVSWFRYHCDGHSTVTATKTLHCAPIRRQAHNCQYTLPILSLCYVTKHRSWALVMFSVSAVPPHQSREHSVLKNTRRCCLMYVPSLCISLRVASTLLNKRIILLLTQDQTHVHRAHLNYLSLFVFQLCTSAINRRGRKTKHPNTRN